MAVDARDGPEIYQSPPAVLVHHYVHLLEVAVDDLLLVQEQQGQADILHHLHLPLLVQVRLGQVFGVVLEVDFPVREGPRNIAVAVVLGNVGADLVAHVHEEVAFVLERNVGLALFALE